MYFFLFYKLNINNALFFFFSSRRRHTRFDCDWSSDVCSSDLAFVATASTIGFPHVLPSRTMQTVEIGRASCRERVEISVVAVSVKKKKIKDGMEGGGDLLGGEGRGVCEVEGEGG